MWFVGEETVWASVLREDLCSEESRESGDHTHSLMSAVVKMEITQSDGK